jgi:hypothetical protein
VLNTVGEPIDSIVKASVVDIRFASESNFVSRDASMTSDKIVLLALCFLISASASIAEEKTKQFDLTAIPDGKDWNLEGRTATKLEDSDKKGVRLDLRTGQGIAWQKGTEFTDGTIEVDLRGEDRPQHSFVGVAFRIQDGTTYDAVYFRPFNFKAADATWRSRSVQYVSHPENTWEKLRAATPGKYENVINPVPDPNGWFHVRIVVKNGKVSVYVDDAKKPCLIVQEIGKRKGGGIGIFAGDQSGGDFANLKITPAR